MQLRSDYLPRHFLNQLDLLKRTRIHVLYMDSHYYFGDTPMVPALLEALFNDMTGKGIRDAKYDNGNGII